MIFQNIHLVNFLLVLNIFKVTEAQIMQNAKTRDFHLHGFITRAETSIIWSTGSITH